MTLSMEMSFVRSPSFHASYLLGHGVAAPEPAVEAEPAEARSIAKLGDDSDNPTYIFTEPRVGYRMPKGDVGRGDGMAVTSWLCGFSIRYNSLRSRHGRPSLRSDTPGII